MKELESRVVAVRSRGAAATARSVQGRWKRERREVELLRRNLLGHVEAT